MWRPVTDVASRRDPQRHDLLGAAAHRVDELERVDAEVVLGLRLDVHLFEPRHAAVAAPA